MQETGSRVIWKPDLVSVAVIPRITGDENEYRQIYSKVPGTVDQEITFPCSVCKQDIRPSGFFYHKKLHKAMATMGFQWSRGRRPDRKTLTLQRQYLLSKLMEASLFNQKIRQSIDSSYELLKKRKESESFKILPSVVGSSVHLSEINNLLIHAVAICEDRNSPWRVLMEDTFIILDNYGNRPNVCFFGLFDGHHGAAAANAARKELPILLLDQLSKSDSSYQMTTEDRQMIDSFDTVITAEFRKLEDVFSSEAGKGESLKKSGYEWLHKAFAKAFWRMDRLLQLGREEVSRVRWSGCSCVICLMESNKVKDGTGVESIATKVEEKSTNLYEGLICTQSMQECESIGGVLHIANTGNAHAVLCRNGRSYCLTKEHSTRSLSERRRIQGDGGTISPNEPTGLTEGIVKTTRGLGHHGNPKFKKSFIPVPQTISVPIDDFCQFLILATNGLWEVLDKSEVMALVMTMLETYEEMYDLLQQEHIQSSKSQLSVFPALHLASNDSINITHPDDNIKLLYFDRTAFPHKRPAASSVSPRDSKIRQSGEDDQHFQSLDPTQYVSESLLKPMAAKPSSSHNVDLSVSRQVAHSPDADDFHLEMRHLERDSGQEIDEELSLPSNTTQSSSGQMETEFKSFYDEAAEYISKQLVEAALKAGSRDNITVLVALLRGCENLLKRPRI
ncbi:protein phosphatase 2C-like domain-containing protein 1 [Tachyglossus aculeatus]|uniref:protein phosphatase 2C-like domain-containing protein 1 n=1 Tax=Tachyglossus aculeatus TaxID=9261 RepID=UPI0018F2F56C|nr:protein phosphatase 2C-like domain-containing protein 1 [Tachyglossus aculeatus]